MDSTVTIALRDVWAAISVLAMLLGVWWRLQAQINELQRRTDKKACRSELHDLRVHIVENYVSRDTLEREMRSIMKALDELRSDIRKLRDLLMERNGHAE